MTDRNPHRDGLTLIVAGVLLNPFVLGAVFSPDGAMHQGGLITLVVLCEILMVGAGIVIMIRRPAHRQIILSMVTALIVLCVVEAGLHIVVYAVKPDHRVPNRRLLLPLYRDSAWAREMFSEDAAVRSDYHSYLGWRSRPFRGRYVNVDSSGCRRTVQAPAPPERPLPLVYVFGGSAAWGIYARDAHTIPSELAGILARQGDTCTVINQAEKGYTFTQGVVRLLLLLQEGKRPDLVIYYDGVNDVLNAYRIGEPGELGLSRYLEGLLTLHQASPVVQFGMLVRDLIINHFMIYKALDQVVVALGYQTEREFAPRSFSAEERHDLACATATHYASAYRILQMLSLEYGFKTVCFLQPSLYTKRRLFPEEERTDDLSTDTAARSLMLETYACLRAKNLPVVADLSAVLDEQPGASYSDFCHVSESSNAVIAAAIADTLQGRHLLSGIIDAVRNRSLLHF